ncbi:MAG: hypothetical protein U0441_14965 [Polyangiaceae bacterium]
MPLDDGYNRYPALSSVAISAVLNASPIDPTTAISTVGASGTYSEATVTNLVSSLDSTINNMSYDRCHDTGHAGTAKLVPTLLYPGFGQARTQFTAAMKRRLASYVDPVSGRSPMPIAVSSRGRGGLGTIDYARDTQDRFDALDHAVAAVGASNVFGAGRSAVVVGYSTGCLDALLAACRCPDRVLAVVLFYPNFDIGADPIDSYWGLVSSSIRSSLITQVGDRAQGAPAAVDPYIACNATDAIGRIVALPNGPHIWVMGDRTEAPTVPIPNPDRLVAAIKAVPGTTPKLHVHITQSGDSNRILHNDGADGAGSVYAERYCYSTILANAAEWTMPRESRSLRLLGWMKTRAVTGSANPADDRPGFEIWTGATTNPKSNANGGKIHACEMAYLDAGRQFTFEPVTSQNGYVQVLRDSDSRNVALTVGARTNVNLNASQTITALSDIGFTHEWRTDVGGSITGTTQVTNWADQIGALAFTASAGATCPSLATDSDSKACLRFASASSQKMLLNSLLIDPTKDFTMLVVCSKSNTTAATVLEVSHHGTLARLAAQYGSGTASAFYYNNSNAVAIENQNGIGGHTWSQNTKQFFALMRKNGVLYVSLTGSTWSKSPIQNEAFTMTGTNTTSVGCGWADSGGAYWRFWDGDVYEVASKDGATSEADLLSAWALLKTRFTF